ncbi:ATP-binding protein, partial [Pseudomonas aeruginosa]
DNALRFTADGGEIRIRLGDRRLSVKNQGPAIPPERLPRLFDRFYRADPARREGQGEHAGLGLDDGAADRQAEPGVFTLAFAARR